ncbi:fatty acid desaturase [Marimonas arenosa]|uniref:Fatty acid desaturase n=1 Tax=Marimonas arenosa TaxID=1795305 RepID=A0AAE3W9L2_9RHOB|nr:fatty acid desaturase [Marimonas arenosa]MDQ2088886.1 fatty acid desaturase [Marimonas arenosa]
MAFRDPISDPNANSQPTADAPERQSNESIRPLTVPFVRPSNALGAAHLGLSLAMWVASIVLGAVFYPSPVALAASAVLFFSATSRLFAVQHDNGHMSYFTSRRANTWVGVLLGAFTAHPFHTMRYNHNRHHAYIGNLDEMESHEVKTMTVAEWQKAGTWARIGYRLYRSPLAICLVGPIAIILIRYRFPKNAMKVGLWDSAVQNVLMASLWGSVYLIGGWPAFATLLIGAIFAVCFATLIIYSGHNHEKTYWNRAGDVDFQEASLQGASVLDLGPVFDFMIFNFSYHDLHHLNSKVPCYRLRECHKALEHLIAPTRLGWRELVGTLRWNLWDEDKGRMVPFSAADPVFAWPAGTRRDVQGGGRRDVAG